MHPPLLPHDSLYDFLARFETTLLKTWQETGFGHLEIDSKKISPDATQIILQAGTHYPYLLHHQEINEVLLQGATQYPYRIQDDFLRRFEALLFEIWQETGYGHLEIQSHRERRNRIAVTLRGATFYRFIIRDEDIAQWIASIAQSQH